MKKQKRELLNNTFNSFIEVGLSGENLEILEDIVSKDVVGFGTTVDEKLFGVKELRDLLIRQKEQSAGMALSWKINTLDLYISSDENTAIFTNEITLYLIVDDNPIEIYLRFSIVMEYADDKWMVVHWHGSKPEHVESEKDTWGVQTWKEKAEELENLVAERTADLVVKNRELEIETALERIRAQAVAMKESTDLLDIVVTMRNEFIKLGHEAHYFWHMMWLPETYEKAMTSGDGTKIGFVMQLPRHIHGNIPQLAKWEKSKKPTVVYTMTVDEAIDYVDKMVSLGDFKNIDPQAPSHDDIRHIGGLTFIMARTTHGEIGYSLPGVVENPPKEDIDILVKFASAFDLAHQRFFDLQKAEKQARETQIELALEKIRSRSMAMHKGDELKEIIQVLYDQLVQLQVKVEHAGFILDYKENEDMHIWLADHNAVFPKIVLPYFDCTHWKSFIEAKRTGQNFFTNQLGFEEKNKFYKDLFQFIPDLPEDTKTTYFGFEGLAISTVLLDNVGLYIENYNGIPFSDEENAILMRFGKVFQQAYTRFLDLQKAEAQAREAKIEAALERTRTQSMLMQHADEIKSISNVFHQQLLFLDIPSEFSYVWLPDESTNSHQFWASWSENKKGKTTLKNKQVTYPLDKSEPYTAACFAAWANPDVIPEVFIPPLDIVGFFDVWKELLQGAQKLKAKYFPQGIYYSEAYMRYGCFGINIRRTLSDEEKNILKRFSIEFERAYTRFLDLKKAEAQAREAQIEASLERVRSRSMAMQKSSELLEAGELLWNEIIKLGIDCFTSGYVLMDDNENIGWNYTPNPSTGKILDQAIGIPHKQTTPMRKIVAEWKKQESLCVIELTRKQTIAHQTFVAEKGINFPFSAKQLVEISPEEIVLYTFNFKQGYLLIVGGEKISKAQIDLMLRFTKVFQQTYARFLDLQKAEAQAREAQIEAALERVRSRTMAMQKSDELQDASLLLFQQVQALGIPPFACGFNIWDGDLKEATAWMGSVHGLQPPFKTSSAKDIYLPISEAAKRGDSLFVIEQEGKDLETHYQYLASIPTFKDIIMLKMENAGISFPTFQIIHCAFFSQGYLMFITYEPIPEGYDIFKRFAKVFDQTYTRFLDLQKAEQHAEQAALDLIKLQVEKKRVEDALKVLKDTQAQLIQSEKMASLGELTAGIAHEIQNPLNFVNNFSEVSNELIDEMNEEIENGDLEEAKAIAKDIKQNLEKINHHGKRADAIVKGMLQHSRSSSDKKELTDINKLTDEYLRLAYHGLRAKNKSFNATMHTDFDNAIGTINVFPQDIGRVILNLITNAFYAVTDKKKTLRQAQGASYKPTVSVSTKKVNGAIEISVSDNGNGIPLKVLDKIFQPFFTTKPTGEGTGLGLSLSYDIVKTHNGELKVNTKEGEGTKFTIILPEA